MEFGVWKFLRREGELELEGELEFRVWNLPRGGGRGMSRMRLAADWEILRLRLVYLGMLAGFALIGATLWHHQVAHGEEYRRDLTRQSMRRVRLPGVRGLSRRSPSWAAMSMSPPPCATMPKPYRNCSTWPTRDYRLPMWPMPRVG